MLKKTRTRRKGIEKREISNKNHLHAHILLPTCYLYCYNYVLSLLLLDTIGMRGRWQTVVRALRFFSRIFILEN